MDSPIPFLSRVRLSWAEMRCWATVCLRLNDATGYGVGAALFFALAYLTDEWTSSYARATALCSPATG